MCGISGVIYKDNIRAEHNIIDKMNKLIAHRGPDGQAIYLNNNIGLGHTRLSIIDLNEGANQPFTDGKYVLVFNGEIYNYLTLKKELADYPFKTESDTEVILAAYDKWGINCVDYMKGMWSFVLYDIKKNIVFCSRDRFGIKPFYYFEKANALYFASEIKQFTCVEGWQAKANVDRVKDFILFEMFDYTEETLFQDVKQLRPGHNLVYDLENHTYSIHTYYDLKSIKANCKYQDENNQVLDLMKQSVKLHLQSDVKLGSCLSGGIDSSTIVMLVSQLKDKSVVQEVVSSCFQNKKYDEQEYIDEVVKASGAKVNKVFPNFNDLFQELEKITWHQDEPFGSTSIFAQWSVFKETEAKGIKVMLDGQGADEVFAGYTGFYSAYLGEVLRKGKVLTWIKEVRALRNYYNYTWRDIMKMTIKYLIPNTLKSKLKLKLDKNSLDWVFIDEHYYKNYLDRLYGIKIKDMKTYSFNQLLVESLPKLLHYEDRDSMAFSVEARVPFLDHELVEYVLSLPSNQKIRKSTTKYCLREAMAEILPAKVKNRRDKMGFVTPEEVWIRENKEVFRKEFYESCMKLNTLLDVEKAMKWFDKLLASNDKIDFTIWRIISTSYWIKVFDIQFN